MATAEREFLAKGFLKSTTLTRKLENTGMDCNRQKSFQGRPPISSQKPVLKRFGTQINQTKTALNCEIPEAPSQEEKRITNHTDQRVELSEENSKVKKSEAENIVLKHKQEGSSLIFERIQKLKKAQDGDEVLKNSNDKFAVKRYGKETPSTLQEGKEAVLEKSKDTKAADSKLDETTKLYKLLPLQLSNERTPRKPARPPTVNLDSINDISSLRSKEQRISRPISELTEEQENEETRSFPNISKNIHAAEEGSEDELYQELD